MARLKQRRSEQAGMLFPLVTNSRIVRLGRSEASEWTDQMGVLKNLVDANESMYPGIGSWFKEKVVPGLQSGQRIAWVGYEGQHAIASAVLKLGRHAKFCHLRIDQDYQDAALGQIFFSLMTTEARHDAKEIHFTLPESLWTNKREFFDSFGFTQATKSRRQYRNGEAELACSATFLTVWSAVLKKLPSLAMKFMVGGYSLNNKVLISIKPKYAGKILAGSKLIEIRKRFSKRWVGCGAVLYSSSPQRAIVGEATVKSVTSGPANDIWSEFGSSIGCTAGDFKAYAGSTQELSAIELSDVIPYKEPLSLAQLSHLVREDLTPPQSFCDVRLDGEDTPWARAVSVASLLHGRFSFTQKNAP